MACNVSMYRLWRVGNRGSRDGGCMIVLYELCALENRQSICNSAMSSAGTLVLRC
jgi:hypothetical protein